ncbi:phospholipid-transporting ATPase IK-like [Ciconia maguari]
MPLQGQAWAPRALPGIATAVEELPGESRHERQELFTWEVRANDRNYHMQFKKKFAFCLTKKKYAGNAIKTAKYNIFTFLPLNLYEQFHRMANVYFVFVILLQTFPEISTLPWYTLLFPLSCLLTIRGLRDLIDDIGRHQSDRNINSRPCEILSGKSFRWQKWSDICVGDIVRLHKESFVPGNEPEVQTSPSGHPPGAVRRGEQWPPLMVSLRRNGRGRWPSRWAMGSGSALWKFSVLSGTEGLSA